MLDNRPDVCYTIIRKREGKSVSAEAEPLKGRKTSPQKRKEDKKMKAIDLTRMSAHVTVDRATRVEIIEKTVGFGEPIAETINRHSPDSTITLTTTGVIVVMSNDGTIITTWIAGVAQAISVYRQATGQKNLPKALWAIVNYNNNTAIWQKMAA